MKALQLKKDGFVAKVILWDVRDDYRKETLTRLAKQGVCRLFWQFVVAAIYYVLLHAVFVVLTICLTIIHTIIVWPVRFLFVGDGINYSWFTSWSGGLYYKLSWMPKNKSGETVGPLSTSFMLSIYMWALVIYCLVSTVMAIGSLVPNLWKIEGVGETFSVFPGVAITAIITFALINNALHDFFKSLKKKGEARKLASAYIEAKRRRFCPQIEWV